MKIIIVGTSLPGGGAGRVRMFRDFLLSKNHAVEVIQVPDQNFVAKMKYYYYHGRGRLQGHEEWHIKKTADELEKRIKKGNYDIAICVETELSYVLTRNLGCKKIFCCESMEANELYFSKKFGNLDRVRKFRQMELEILTKADYVVFPWKTTEEFTRKYIWDGDNFITIKYGCSPREKHVSYFFPPAIVSLGTMRPYWTNKELMAYLTGISPYTIHVYGNIKSANKYNINYKGFAPSFDVFYNYQFGLVTLTNTFRLFTSRVLNYLSFGLPALCPEWLSISYELKGVLPYNQQNFVELIEKYSDKKLWEALSEEAHKQASELDWHITCQPLEKIIDGV